MISSLVGLYEELLSDTSYSSWHGSYFRILVRRSFADLDQLCIFSSERGSLTIYLEN